MEAYLGKSYKLEKSENFDEYLKFIEVRFFSRKNASSVWPTSTLAKNPDGTYTFTIYFTLRSAIVTFKPGVEVIEERADGVKVRSIFEIEDNKLIQTQIEQNGRKSTHVREYKGDTMIVTTTADGWDDKCVRTYKLVD